MSGLSKRCFWQTVILLGWHPPFSSFSSISGVRGAKSLLFVGRMQYQNFRRFSSKPPVFGRGQNDRFPKRPFRQPWQWYGFSFPFGSICTGPVQNFPCKKGCPGESEKGLESSTAPSWARHTCCGCAWMKAEFLRRADWSMTFRHHASNRSPIKSRRDEKDGLWPAKSLGIFTDLVPTFNANSHFSQFYNAWWTFRPPKKIFSPPPSSARHPAPVYTPPRFPSSLEPPPPLFPNKSTPPSSPRTPPLFPRPWNRTKKYPKRPPRITMATKIRIFKFCQFSSDSLPPPPPRSPKNLFCCPTQWATMGPDWSGGNC